jgi:iron complex transport system substrate-binding protein
MKKAILALLVLASILCMGSMPAMCTEKTITDMEGRTVTISEPLERVVTAGYSIAPCVMAAFGIGDKIVGAGGAVYPGGNFTTVPAYLIPALQNMSDLGRGSSLNAEAAIALNPNILILEVDCAGQGDSTQKYGQLIEKLDLFKESVPLVVIKNGACANPPSPDNIYQEIEILGEIFDKQAKAKEMIDFLKQEVDLVKQRTEGIKEDEKPSVLFGTLLGWSSDFKGALISVSPDYTGLTFYPDITNIKNAYKGNASVYADMSSEQLLALNPDVIILGHSKKEWKAEDIYNESEYKAIQGIEAIKNKRVYSTGQFTLYGFQAGLEFPIEMLIEAKAAYPDRFKDINVGEQLTKHYKALYGLNDEQVKELKKCIHLDWMDEEGF